MPDLTRRSLLTLGGTAGLFVLTTAPAEAATRASIGLTRLVTPSGQIGGRGAFTPLVGRTVVAAGQSRRYRLKLVRISDVDRAASTEHSFNLIFAGPAGDDFVEGIYRLSGPGLPAVSLLLTPFGADGLVQALINRP